MFGIFKDVGKKQTAIEVIAGRNTFKKDRHNLYSLVSEEKKKGSGIVKVSSSLRSKGNYYKLLNVYKHEKHKRSAGKTALGAIAGGLIGGGIGTVAGAGIGAKRKDDSIFDLTLQDVETDEVFTIQVKEKLKSGTPLVDFPLYYKEN